MTQTNEQLLQVVQNTIIELARIHHAAQASEALSALAELEARLSEFDVAKRYGARAADEAADWLLDSAASASEHDPSVGLFADDELASCLNHLSEIIRPQPPAGEQE